MDFSPFYDAAQMLYDGAWVAERMTVVEELWARDADAIFPVTRDVIGKARRLAATDAFRGAYRLAELKRRCEPLLRRVDLLCVPTFPCFVSLADLATDPIGANSRLGYYTNFVNLLDLCAASPFPPACGSTGGRAG